jgi:mono/diheme cytochrome c family protein
MLSAKMLAQKPGDNVMPASLSAHCVAGAAGAAFAVPSLTSIAGLTKSISEGVLTPKHHLGAMPPMGGSPLSEADLKAVAAYVWSIGHRGKRG